MCELARRPCSETAAVSGFVIPFGLLLLLLRSFLLLARNAICLVCLAAAVALLDPFGDAFSERRRRGEGGKLDRTDKSNVGPPPWIGGIESNRGQLTCLDSAHSAPSIPSLSLRLDGRCMKYDVPSREGAPKI